MSRVIVIAASILGIGLSVLANQHDGIVAKEGEVTTLPPKLIELHERYPGCVKLNDPVMPRSHYAFSAKIDGETEVFGILCEPSTYNQPYAIYIVREGYYEDAERVFFADYNLESGWTGTDLLYNAYFNKNNGVLKGFSKGRGLADCGSQISMKWDGEQFSMMEYRYKDACDENTEKPFPLIYKRHQEKK